MRDDVRHVVRLVAVAVERLARAGLEDADRRLVDFAAVHLHVLLALFVHLGREGLGAAAAGDVEDVRLRPVGVQMCGKESVSLARLGHQDHRAGGVAEEDAGVAVAPVHDPGQQFGPDDQDRPGAAALDEAVGDGQRVERPGAGRADVEAGGFGRADLGLDEHGRRRERHVGRDRAADDHVEVFGLDPGHLQRLPARRGSHVAGRFAGRRQPALADAGPLADPGVAGLDAVQFHHIVVGHHLLGEVGAGADDSRALHGCS